MPNSPVFNPFRQRFGYMMSKNAWIGHILLTQQSSIYRESLGRFQLDPWFQEVKNGSFAWSGYMIQNHTCCDVSCTVGKRNKGRSRWTGTSCFVLEVPMCNLRRSMCESLPCDRIVQRVYCKWYCKQPASQAVEREGGKSNWAREGEGTPRSSRVRSPRASRARLSPFPPLRTPVTQATL